MFCSNIDDMWEMDAIYDTDTAMRQSIATLDYLSQVNRYIFFDYIFNNFLFEGIRS